MTTESSLLDNPYVGPRPLKLGEPIFGRDNEARNLLNSLIGERIVLLHSPSGAGKTSLIQAKLVPELQEEGFRVLPLIRLATPAADASESVNRYVASTLSILDEELQLFEECSNELYALTIEQYLDHARAQTKARAEEMHLLSGGSGERAAMRRVSRGTRTVLIFDQFEEVLTLDPFDENAKSEFFSQLRSALSRSDQWALFAMREEYLAALDPYARVLPSGFRSRSRLALLTPDDAVLAVEKPAAAAGVPFAPGTARKLVDSLRRIKRHPEGTAQTWFRALVQWFRMKFRRLPIMRGDAADDPMGPYVEPVQLQVVCRSLWWKLSPDTTVIGDSELAVSGNVDLALREYYESMLIRVSKKLRVRKERIRAWVGSLITRDGYRGLSSEVPHGRKGQEIVRELVGEYLVRAEDRRGSTWYELAHDRLIRPIATSNREAQTGRTVLLAYAGVMVAFFAIVAVNRFISNRATAKLTADYDLAGHFAQQQRVRETSLPTVRTEAGKELRDLNWKPAIDKHLDDSQVQIQYFSRRSDPPNLAAALNKAGFSIEVHASSVPSSVATNCLWYGKNVPEKSIRAAALAAMQTGIPLQALLPFRQDSKPDVMQLGANTFVTACRILTPELVAKQALSGLNCGQKTPIGDRVEE